MPGTSLDELEASAAETYLRGRIDESAEQWAAAHQRALEAGDTPRAARCAFWLAFALTNAGQLARAGGWIDRTQRLLDAGGHECVEHGYIRYCAALGTAFRGDASSAEAGFAHAAKIGERFGDAQLTCLARTGQGRCLIALGEVRDGVALLDEAMVSVLECELAPAAVGDTYCTVLEGCGEVFDVGRAREWTAAFTRWCDAHPDVVLFGGQCLIHRAELSVLAGALDQALAEIRSAVDRLTRPVPAPALGLARYVEGEVHRLRGAAADAEAAYRDANGLGCPPQPGFALLRSQQGRAATAFAAIRRALDETEGPLARARLLPAAVDLAVGAGDLDAARAAALELDQIAAEWGPPLLRAAAAVALAEVELAGGDAAGAVAAARRACTAWAGLGAPYQAAQARVVVALACRALDDADGATMELEAARAAFAEIGAAPELARVDRLLRPAGTRGHGGLTPRELEVLVLLATGRSNRAIAEELVVSEKTVATHVGSILSKLGLPSRSAATSYAYEHDLVRPV